MYFTVLTTIVTVVVTSVVAFTITVTITVINDAYYYYCCYFCYAMSSRIRRVLQENSPQSRTLFIFKFLPNIWSCVNYCMSPTHSESGLHNQHGSHFSWPSRVSRWHRADRLASIPKHGGRFYDISILFSSAVNAAGPPGSSWPLQSENMSRRSWARKCHNRKYQSISEIWTQKLFFVEKKINM